VLKPFIFIKTDKDFYMKGKNANVIQDFKMVETERGRAVIFHNKHGIKRLIIPIKILQSLTN